MDNKERFLYYARSNGIIPDVLGRDIKIASGIMRVIGQREHKAKPILVRIGGRKYAMPVWKLRVLLRKYGQTRYLNMQSAISNVDLWFAPVPGKKANKKTK